MATRSRIKWEGRQWHTGTDCSRAFLFSEEAGELYAEETFGCCGGCVGCGGCAIAVCACEVLLGLACWVESWDNWSLFERDFNSAFSRSSKEFLSTNSFICSFRTSTSSLTAYIKWLFTRSCGEQVNSYTKGKKNSFIPLQPQSLLFYGFHWSKW